jgi:hypothetical protein
VRDVLRSFLPAPYEIGSGIAFTSGGEYSHQLDIVIYDSRLPVLRQPDGVSMFPIESVAAYIEVKSTLDAKELGDGLTKCSRLMSLGQNLAFSQEDSEEFIRAYP